jgi:hypothetical protein
LRNRHQIAVICLFFAFGLVAVVLEVFFVRKTVTAAASPALSLFTYARTVASPGVFFVPAMILAGILVWAVGLVPHGISFSLWRVAGAAVLGFFSYPLGYLATSVGMLVLFGIALSSPDTPPGAPTNWLQFLGGCALAVGVLFAGEMLTLFIVTSSFALATHFWPRPAFFWFASLSATAIIGGILASLIKSKLLFPTEPISYLVSGRALDLLFGHAWGIPLVVLIGQPLLAALMGHWLHLAANQQSTGAP